MPLWYSHWHTRDQLFIETDESQEPVVYSPRALKLKKATHFQGRTEKIDAFIEGIHILDRVISENIQNNRVSEDSLNRITKKLDELENQIQENEDLKDEVFESDDETSSITGSDDPDDLSSSEEA